MRETILQVEERLKSISEITDRDVELAKKKAKKLLSPGQDEIKFYYTSHVKGKYMYFCTRCQKWHVADRKWPKGKKHACKCGKRLKVTGPFEMEYVKADCDVTKLENIKGKLIARVIHVERIVSKKNNYIEKFNVYEVARLDIARNVALKRYTYRSSDGWGEIRHSMSWVYSYADKDIDPRSFLSDMRTKYYKEYRYDITIGSLKGAIKGTEFRYSALPEAVKLLEWIDPVKYLEAYKKVPDIEKFVKSGAVRATEDTYKSPDFMRGLIEEIGSRGVKKIIKNDLSLMETAMLARCDEANPDMSLIRLMASVNYDKSYDDAKKERRKIAYVSSISCKKEVGCKREAYWLDYQDYMKMCIALGEEMDKRTLYPEDFWEAHDAIAKRYAVMTEKKEDELLNKGIYKNALAHLKMSFGDRSAGLLIRPAVSRGELISESANLKHCVRTYAKDVAAQRTEIFFIRKISDKDKSFVTLEMKGGKIIQCRAKCNARPDDHVVDFVNKWAVANNLISCFWR